MKEEYIIAAIFAFNSSSDMSVVQVSRIKRFIDPNVLPLTYNLIDDYHLANAYNRIESDIVDVYQDNYGPTIVRIKSKINQDLLIEACPVFRNVSVLPVLDERLMWIEEALRRLEASDPSSGQEARDRNAEEDWAPLELDMKESEFDQFTDSLDELIDAVGADNGYAATYPAERNSVVESLKAGRAAIKAGAIAKRAFRSLIVEPAKQVASKFKNAATELIANKLLELVTKFFGSLGG